MKTTAENESNWFKGIPLLVMIALFVALVIFIFNALSDGDRYGVIKLNTKESASNISKGFIFYSFGADSLYGQAMLAEKGDLIWLDDQPFYYNNLDDDSLSIEPESDSLVYINGKLHSLIIEGKQDLLPWFKQAPDAVLSSLQTICINTNIPKNYFPYLEKIAQLNPHIGIRYRVEQDNEMDSGDLEKLTRLFSPQLAVIGLTQKQVPLLSRWKGVELLYLDILEESDSATSKTPDSTTAKNTEEEQPLTFNGTLAAFPKLKQFILTAEEPYILNKDFFINNPQIDQLTIMTQKEVSFLQALPHLKQLNIMFDTLDISRVGNYCKELHLLTLEGETYTGLSALDSLKNLTWLGLPSNTTQQTFNTVLQHQTGLQVLELHGNGSLTNLQPLLQLTNLMGLVIQDTVSDYKTLQSLEQLSYLSLPAKTFKDSTAIRSLQKALPGCIIVPNSGACLGSGWLLLLVPLVLLFLLFKNMYAAKTSAHTQHKNS